MSIRFNYFFNFQVKGPEPLNLEAFESAFFLLLIGIGFAFTCFIAEVIMKRLSCKKK